MNTTTAIIIHHSASPDHPVLSNFEAVRDFHVHVRGWRDIGYHFVVEMAGGRPVVRYGRKPWDVGAHCPGYNRSSLGVCVIGDYTERAPGSALLVCTADLVAGLGLAHQISPDRVLGHREASRKPTACPGDAFPIKKFREMVAGVLENRYGRVAA